MLSFTKLANNTNCGVLVLAFPTVVVNNRQNWESSYRFYRYYREYHTEKTLPLQSITTGAGLLEEYKIRMHGR